MPEESILKSQDELLSLMPLIVLIPVDLKGKLSDHVGELPQLLPKLFDVGLQLLNVFR